MRTTDPTSPYPASDPETRAKAAEARAGYVSNYQVKATPEEVEAVQFFSKRLVEDYGYAKSQIQTRPQFRVRKSPSDEDKGYPIDIVVFRDDSKTEDNAFLIVECKKRTRKDGIAQLKLYMDMLLALLNTPIVRRQMKAKQFTRDVIDTLGKRLLEVVIPVPNDSDKCRRIAKEVREVIETRVSLRNRTKEIALEVQGIEAPSEEDAAVLEEI